MAREESDREDILREATALVDRAELHVDGFAETIVFGFRRNGALSLFVTQDEVYQFDTKNTLRRGYLGTRLLKADRGQLMEISRVRSAQETTLVTRPLPCEEQDRLLERLSLRLEQLRDAIVRRQAFRVVGSVSASGEDSVARFTHWLETMIGPIGVARQAGVC